MNKAIVKLHSTAKRMTNYDNLDVEYSDEHNPITVSDGHHTMDELYQHRHALFCALLKVYDNYITPLNSRVKCWKSRVHHSGDMYPGWFIAGMTVMQIKGPMKQITYHLPMEWWDKFNVMEYAFAPEWDGHTSDDVLERLLEL